MVKAKPCPHGRRKNICKQCKGHIKPLDCAKENHPYHSPIEELTHYSNLQPLLKEDNLKKGAKWSSASDAHWRKNIYLNEEYDAIFMLV